MEENAKSESICVSLNVISATLLVGMIMIMKDSGGRFAQIISSDNNVLLGVQVQSLSADEEWKFVEEESVRTQYYLNTNQHGSPRTRIKLVPTFNPEIKACADRDTPKRKTASEQEKPANKKRRRPRAS